VPQPSNQDRELLEQLRDLPDDEALDLVSEVRGFALRSATAAIMARNFSHGVGPAVMDTLADQQ